MGTTKITGTIYKEVAVKYKATFTPPEKATRDYPGCPAECDVEILSIEEIEETDDLLAECEEDAWDKVREANSYTADDAANDKADWKRDERDALMGIMRPI